MLTLVIVKFDDTCIGLKKEQFLDDETKKCEHKSMLTLDLIPALRSRRA